MKKPSILFTLSNIESDALSQITGDSEIVYSDTASADAVLSVGGMPFFMPSVKDISEEDVNSYLDSVHGLYLPGEDVDNDPKNFGDKERLTNGRVDSERERVDILLVQSALSRGMPVLGICKGMQIMNVALGGKLYQDISLQLQGSINHDRHEEDRSVLTHAAKIVEGTIIANTLGRSKIMTNGGHQQGIKALGADLIASAKAKDGIIEIFEHISHPFFIGVQFHTELRMFDPTYAKIIESFIFEARKYSERNKERFNTSS